jgi:hypothetical protein
MLLTLYIVTVLLNLLMVLTKKRNSILAILSMIFIVFFMSGYSPYKYKVTDFYRYANWYKTQKYFFTMEKGYVWLSSVFSKLNFSYVVFAMFMVITGGCLYLSAAKIFKNNYHILILIYITTMVFVDAEGIRQYVAYAAYTFFLVALAKNKRLYAFVILILASFIQRSILFFIPLCFLNLKEVNKRKEKIWFLQYLFMPIILFICFITFLNHNKIPGLESFIGLINLVVPASKNSYFEHVTRLGFLLSWVGFLVNYIGIKYVALSAKSNRDEFTISELELIDVLNISCLYTGLFLLFCMLDRNFDRFFKFNIMPTALIISIAFRKRIKFKYHKIILVFLIMLIILTYAFVFQSDLVVELMFNCNKFFS